MDTCDVSGTVFISGWYVPSSSQLGYSFVLANGPFMMPVPNRAISKARFMYTLDACKDLQKADDLGFTQAGNLMIIKCQRYAVQLGLTTGATSSK